MYNDHFLKDYISLVKREENQENQKLGHPEISTNPSPEININPSETPETVNQSPIKPRRSQRQKPQHYQYQHIVIEMQTLLFKICS